ncbi:MAG: hypothetical protein AAGG81_08300, partial [Chlamydiota bacterium]
MNSLTPFSHNGSETYFQPSQINLTSKNKESEIPKKRRKISDDSQKLENKHEKLKKAIQQACPFDPVTSFQIKDLEFRDIVIKELTKYGVVFYYHSESCDFFFPYSHFTMPSIARAVPILEKHLGEGSKNFFEGYPTSDLLQLSSVRFYPQYEAAPSLNVRDFKALQIEDSKLRVNTYSEVHNKLLKDLDFEGVIYGQNCDRSLTRQMIIEEMPKLKKMGVETIYIEFFETELQGILDEYLTNDHLEVPKIIENVLKEIWGFSHYNSYSHLQLIKTAKKHKIRVVGLETARSMMAGHGHFRNFSKDRNLWFKTVALDIITTNQQKKESKYIVLCGNTHLTSLNDNAGLSELLQQPCVTFFSSELKLDHYHWKTYQAIESLDTFRNRIVISKIH